jgi:hypothetical protein
LYGRALKQLENLTESPQPQRKKIKPPEGYGKCDIIYNTDAFVNL